MLTSQALLMPRKAGMRVLVCGIGFQARHCGRHLPVDKMQMKMTYIDLSNWQSNQQMHGKTAPLKSSVPCTEKPEKVQKAPDDSSLHWSEGSKSEEIKKYGREGTLLSKYNQQYHKLFKDIPLEEMVLKVCSCALQRDLLLHGRLYISPNWLCFHASLFGKDIKVVIPVVSVQLIKKHKMARLLPNGLAITTNTSQKYVFVSLLSRDSVYDMLRRVCTHLQPSSKKSLSVRKFPEEAECESPEVLIPEMKWRKVCPASTSLSLPDNISCVSRIPTDSTDSCFPSRKPSGSETACDADVLEEEPMMDQELRLWDSRLLKVIFVMICFLVVSSSYLAFRISRLEQQLCSLNWGGPLPGDRDQRRVLQKLVFFFHHNSEQSIRSLKVELPMAVSHHVVAGNQTQVLCKNIRTGVYEFQHPS
ncbi:GRAM domain-containing protein 2 [Cricetulus griseus]|uniref:GRAM domain-containing protein 2 n=2 Tax=Cricetulus griseus TaxID=10029 RepID=A0A061I5W1_CRIGR|nr:GRAM domain-containing protein 2 [Cricetulus griseus]